MQVQDFKRWHWLVIALGVGLALSYVWSSVEWDENLPTIGQREFEAGLTIAYPTQGHLENVTVMPLGVDGAFKVVAEQVRNTKTPGVIDLRPVAFRADVPYKAGMWRGEGEEHPNVLEFLKKTKEVTPEVKFRYAWYRETWAIFMLWTGASVLLIGGVWPSVVSLMVGAGLGLQREEKGPDYDLSRFKSEADPAGEHRDLTAAEIAHMRELEAELERKLEAQRLGMPIPEDEPVGATAAAPQKLDGGPLEAAAIDKPAEEHEYRGEFYPVDRHLPKKKS
jgi:hypothetical protein